MEFIIDSTLKSFLMQVIIRFVFFVNCFFFLQNIKHKYFHKKDWIHDRLCQTTQTYILFHVNFP
jgi:fatty acid desaturase